jgi:hypothetical protein
MGRISHFWDQQYFRQLRYVGRDLRAAVAQIRELVLPARFPRKNFGKRVIATY